MSAPDLPDDPRDWPDDPFAVLGVRPGAPETDIKRAYTRLIRRFKPEHSPEQFRRVREAYEICLERTRWFAPPPDDPPAPDPFVVVVRRPEPTPSQPQPEAEPAAPDPTPEPPAPVIDEADRLWDLAAGDGPAAYAGLAELAAARPDRADVPLRLYWLLALDPVLDADRTRHHWLAEALTRSNLSGPAAELYRRELEADPDAALRGPYRDLLARDCPPATLLTLARWRIDAAGRTASWHTLQADLDAVRPRLILSDEVAWLGLVASALSWAEWDRPRPLYAQYHAELGRLRHLELRHSHHFDQLEGTAAALAAWAGADARNLPEPLREMVRRAWGSWGGLRPADVAPAAAAVAADPVRTLHQLDRVLRSLGPDLPLTLLRLFDRHRAVYGPADDPEFPPELVRGAFRAWAARRRVDFAWLRTELPEFFAAEAVGPAELADACAADPDFRFRNLAESVRNDLGLRLVWLATRIHRG